MPRPKRHCVRWGPSPLCKNGAEPPIFNPCLLWPNGWMDQDATWYGGRPRPRPRCARWGPSLPPKMGAGTSPNFSPIVAKRLDGSRCHLLWRSVLVQATFCYNYMRTHLSPQKGGTAAPTFRPMSIVAKRLDGSRCHLVWR